MQEQMEATTGEHENIHPKANYQEKNISTMADKKILLQNTFGIL